MALLTRFHRCNICPLLAAALAAVALLAAAPPAAAQPFGAWITLAGKPQNGYFEVPHHPALNPTGAFTLEAWVSVSNTIIGDDCRSIAGKNFQQAWWIGVCSAPDDQLTLRAYLKGGSSARTGGIVPRNKLTHVAVTFGAGRQKHYINGELALDVPLAGPLTTSTSPVRIGSDVNWNQTPSGIIDEVRLWNVARTQAQIRSAINVAITAPQPGLVAVWHFDGAPVGGFGGATAGSGVGFLTFPVAIGCTPSATRLCVHDRFAVTTEWRKPDGTTGVGTVAPLTTVQSGIFWFFNPTNWEVMVKVLNACPSTNTYWVFSAATTNVFYRMTVTDQEGGAQKIFFNYPGPPAPAVTDTQAFATCP